MHCIRVDAAVHLLDSQRCGILGFSQIFSISRIKHHGTAAPFEELLVFREYLLLLVLLRRPIFDLLSEPNQKSLVNLKVIGFSVLWVSHRH